MKSFTAISALSALLLASLTAAAPAGGPQAPPGSQVSVKFIGATPSDAQTQTFNRDGQSHVVNDNESISYIQILGQGTCQFFGVDGGEGVVPPSYTFTGPQSAQVPIGPPQELDHAICY